MFCSAIMSRKLDLGKLGVHCEASMSGIRTLYVYLTKFLAFVLCMVISQKFWHTYFYVCIYSHIFPQTMWLCVHLLTYFLPDYVTMWVFTHILSFSRSIQWTFLGVQDEHSMYIQWSLLIFIDASQCTPSLRFSFVQHSLELVKNRKLHNETLFSWVFFWLSPKSSNYKTRLLAAVDFYHWGASLIFHPGLYK